MGNLSQRIRRLLLCLVTLCIVMACWLKFLRSESNSTTIHPKNKEAESSALPVATVKKVTATETAKPIMGEYHTEILYAIDQKYLRYTYSKKDTLIDRDTQDASESKYLIYEQTALSIPKLRKTTYEKLLKSLIENRLSGDYEDGTDEFDSPTAVDRTVAPPATYNSIRYSNALVTDALFLITPTHDSIVSLTIEFTRSVGLSEDYVANYCIRLRGNKIYIISDEIDNYVVQEGASLSDTGYKQIMKARNDNATIESVFYKYFKKDINSLVSGKKDMQTGENILIRNIVLKKNNVCIKILREKAGKELVMNIPYKNIPKDVFRYVK